MLADGEHIRAGGRDLRVVARPGHSTTDALLVDERERIAFVGDHLLAKISSNTEIYPALEPDGHAPARARRVPGEPAADGRDATRGACTPDTAPTSPITPGSSRSGSPTTSAAATGSSPRSRPARPPRTGSPPTCGREQTIPEQPLFVVWEVLGHLDLLLDAGRVREQVTEDGSTYGVASFALAGTPTHAH